MKKIKAAGVPLTVNSGQVQLNADQARRRKPFIKPVKVSKDGAGVYDVMIPIMFKVGEEFGFDGDVGKNGVLADPEAERLAALAAEEAAVAKATAKLAADHQAALQALHDDYAGRIAAAVEGAEESLLARLTSHTAESVRAELARSLV